MAVIRKPLTKGQAEVIDALAHHMVIVDLGKNVKGMESFPEHWMSTAQTAKQKQYVSALVRRIGEVRKDFSNSLKED